jgi:hypothetical protein
MTKYHSIAAIVLVFFMTPLNAEVSENNIKNNDKVITASEPAQQDTTGLNISDRNIESGSEAWLLHAEQWELARSGESILSLPVLKQLVNTWLQDKNKKIEIQYPGGEEGEFWVQVLSDWMVSLGIPSNHMVLVASSGSADVIKFDLVK